LDSKDFHRLFSYDDWANREVLNALKIAPAPRPLELLSHLFSSERLWLERLRRQAQSFPVWPSLSVQECQAQAEELPGQWHQYIDEMGDSGMARTITYKNTVGDVYTSRVDDVLLHVIMHSTYHRGQVAAAMRAAGATPAYTDFIHGVRHGLIE